MGFGTEGTPHSSEARLEAFGSDVRELLDDQFVLLRFVAEAVFVSEFHEDDIGPPDSAFGLLPPGELGLRRKAEET